MADQKYSGNSGWYNDRMSQVGGMNHTRTASGIDHHEVAMHRHMQEQIHNEAITRVAEKELQKQEKKEQEEDIYYLLT